jgi:hypothetical protein
LYSHRKGKIELKEDDIVIIPPRKKHSVSISKDGVLDLIRIGSQAAYTIILPLEERKRERILKPRLPSIPLADFENI